MSNWHANLINACRKIAREHVVDSWIKACEAGAENSMCFSVSNCDCVCFELWYFNLLLNNQRAATQNNTTTIATTRRYLSNGISKDLPTSKLISAFSRYNELKVIKHVFIIEYVFMCVFMSACRVPYYCMKIKGAALCICFCPI